MKPWLKNMFGKERSEAGSDGRDSVQEGDARKEVQKGMALFQAKKYEIALTHFDRAISLDPSRSDAWSNKGACHHERNEIPEAISCLRKSLDLWPDNGVQWFNLGRSLEAQKDLFSAIDAFSKAVDATEAIDDRTRVRALASRGQIELDMDRNESAAKSFRRAVELDPNFSGAKMSLAIALMRVSAHDEAKAVILSIHDSHYQGVWEKDANGAVTAAVLVDGKPAVTFLIQPNGTY